MGQQLLDEVEEALERLARYRSDLLLDGIFALCEHKPFRSPVPGGSTEPIEGRRVGGCAHHSELPKVAEAVIEARRNNPKSRRCTFCDAGLVVRPCTCTLRINPPGSPADRHRSKKS
jgi:hypothetical protein